MKIVTIIAIASACLLCSMNSFADIAQDEYTLGMKYLALYKAKGSAQYFDKALEHLNNSAEQGNTAAASEFSKQTLKFYLEICDDDGKGFNIIMSSQIDELLSQAEASLEREKQFGCLKPEHEDILKEIKIMKRSKKLLRRLVEKMVQETDASKKGEAAVGEKKGTLAPPNSVAKSDERLKTGDTKTITLPGGATMEMIYCAPGSFMMGSPTSEEGRDDNEKQHQVTLTKGFWLGKYEVTQAQWQSVMGENPSKFEGDKRPVENVSWEDCQRFIAKVNAEARRQFGGGARLPTEAEWEYACRAGTTTAFSWGNALNGDRANCDGNYPCGTTVKGRYRQGTADVGSYSPNAWGFYDMHGNVLEWCEDWRGDYGSATTDPTGPASGERRVLRGGFWDGYARHCRSALRGGSNPSYRCSRLGFRLCCSAGPREAGAEREDSRAAEPGGRDGAGHRYAASTGVTAKEESGIEASVSRDILPKDAKHGQEAVLALPGGTTMEMIYCAPGSFMMGSPTSEEGRVLFLGDDEKQHQVTLTKGYWLGKYEVTQEQWQSVMGENPSEFKGDKRPVENVSWEDCQRFIAKVNAEARRQFGGGARLPTEAEWEYACRAGTTTAFSWGNALNGDRANCDGNCPCGTTVKGRYRQGTADVGSYSPNAWGFYDMHGNVVEWCEDWFGDYGSATTDPTGPASGVGRVFRGGGWYDRAGLCRSANRDRLNPGCRRSSLGFRLCCSALP